MKKELFIIAVLLFISSILLLPLLHYGFPPSHDGEYHVIRGYEFYRTLQDGNLYPRWLPDLNNGYGVPLMNYYYPFPYYAMALFHLLGAGFIDSFKIGMVAATFIGAFFFYLWARIFWGKWGGFLSSIFYTFSPYHIVDIYIRGSAGEVWSLAFFPGFLWSITKALKDNRPIYILISSLFLALIIFSHNILAYMFALFAFGYCGFLLYLSPNRKKTAKSFFIVFLLGLGISAIFWFPALFERGYVRGLLIYNVLEQFPEIYQLIFPSWGSGFSSLGISGQMSFQIGVANLLSAVISILVLWKLFRKKNKKDMSVIIFFLASFLIVFFIMTQNSYFLWKSFPFFNYFQFPWRFLSLEILITSFLAGSSIYLWNSKIFSIILISIALLSVQYTTPAYYWERNDNYYLTRSNFIDGTNTPGNVFNTIWFNNNLKKTKEKLIFLSGSGKIESEVIKSTNYKFIIDSKTESKIQINTAYFPGWVVYIDGENKKTAITRDGLFSFTVGRGKHQLIIKFEDTNLRKLANSISIFSILVLFAISKFVKIKR